MSRVKLNDPDPHVRARMRSQARASTAPEMNVRRALFARGLRYRVGLKVPGSARRTIDIAFPRNRVAVFVDGCFWHKCPLHSVPVKNNATWWIAKLDANVARDRATTQLLEAQGWRVIRAWEHEDPANVVDTVVRALEESVES